MKKLLCVALLALAGCQVQPLNDNQRAILLQHMQTQQVLQQQQVQQNYEAAQPHRSIQTFCTRSGDQIFCNSN